MVRPSIIVTGFSRCGSSMMMEMLEAGGVPLYAGAGKPSGYESQNTATTYSPNGLKWLGDIGEHAAKLLLAPGPEFPHLPTRTPRIWIELFRDSVEQARSICKLANMVDLVIPEQGIPIIRENINRASDALLEWLDGNQEPHYSVEFEEILESPDRIVWPISRMLRRHGWDLDPLAMAEVVVHNRPLRCLDKIHPRDSGALSTIRRLKPKMETLLETTQ